MQLCGVKPSELGRLNSSNIPVVQLVLACQILAEHQGYVTKSRVSDTLLKAVDVLLSLLKYYPELR